MWFFRGVSQHLLGCPQFHVLPGRGSGRFVIWSAGVPSLLLLGCLVCGPGRFILQALILGPARLAAARSAAVWRVGWCWGSSRLQCFDLGGLCHDGVAASRVCSVRSIAAICSVWAVALRCWVLLALATASEMPKTTKFAGRRCHRTVLGRVEPNLHVGDSKLACAAASASVVL